MTKYEYKTLPLDVEGQRELDALLNQEGAQGWDLVHVESGNEAAYPDFRRLCIFKREAVDTNGGTLP